MHFGDKITSSQNPSWSEHYVDYNRLKKILYQIFELESSDHLVVAGGDNIAVDASDDDYDASGIVGGFLSSTYQLSPVKIDASSNSMSSTYQLSPVKIDASSNSVCVKSTEAFRQELDKEIETAVLFTLKALGELAADLSELLKRQKMTPSMSNINSPFGYSAQEGGAISQDDLNISDHSATAATAAIQQIAADATLAHHLNHLRTLRKDLLVLVGSKLLLLLEFVELNIQAIDKIVKKHDKLLSIVSTKRRDSLEDSRQYRRLRREYAPRFAVYGAPNLRCLFKLAADAGAGGRGGDMNDTKFTGQMDTSFGGWDVIESGLSKALKAIYDEETHCIKLHGMGEEKIHEREICGSLEAWKPNQGINHSHKETKATSTSALSSFSLISRSSSLMSETKMAIKNSFNGSSPSLSDASKNVFFEPMLYRISASRRRLGQVTKRYIRMVYAHEMGVHLIDVPHDDDSTFHDTSLDLIGSTTDLLKEGEEGMRMYGQRVPMVSRLSKFLNLASAGLYMCNYNIVAPTSGMYAELLGFDPANAGIIIGMTPFAVLGSAVLYSYWSSYSYKKALLFASGSCVVGNMVYALALPCDSLLMVLLGRLLTGFGSSRIISRRYIADYYSIEDRTSGMADFVSASAFGMAIGPGIAAALSFVAPTGPSNTNRWWTVETAPGYIMFVSWLMYWVLNYFYFEEPERAYATETSPVKDQKKTNDKSIEIETQTEETPLVNKALYDNITVHSMKSKKKCVNIPVLLSLILLMVLKCTLEGLSSSTPTVSRYYFGWGVHASGIYLAAVASLMLPINFFIAHISRRYDDRELILGLLILMLAGILGILDYGGGGSDSYSETRFIFFGFIIFLGSTALEGPTMGLLSKTIPSSLAKGVLNAGLLATEAGTIGRVFGDMWLTSAAFGGLEKMLNRTFEPMAIMVFVSCLLTLWTYKKLLPQYDEDDDVDRVKCDKR